MVSLRESWKKKLKNRAVHQKSRGPRKLPRLVRSETQRVLNIETRCVDVLHRPQARGAFAAAIYTLQRECEPSLEVDVNKGAAADRPGRHDARRARTQYRDSAGHR